MVRIALTVIVGFLVAVGVAWVVLAFAHGHLAVVPVERPAARDWGTPALRITLIPLVVGSGLATLAWWAWRFLRARLHRRGPWG